MIADRWVILGLILTAQTVANIGPYGMPAIAALIRSDLGLTLTQAGSFLSAYYIGPALMSLPAGTLADRWGVGRTLILGQAVLAFGLAAAAGSPSYTVLVLLMMVTGGGYGLLNPTSTKAVIAWSPPRKRATFVGIKQVGLPFGGALGAALLPGLALLLGWRLAVVAAASLIGATALASVFLYRDPEDFAPPAGTGARGDLRAVLLTSNLWLVASSTTIFAAMQTIWQAYLVLYLQEVVGLPLLAAGWYLAAAQASGMAGRVVFGLLSDRTFGGRRRLPLAIAGIGSTLCSVAIAMTGPGTSPAWLAALVLVFGFAGIGWNGVQHTLMAELAGPRTAGTAVGLGLAVSSLGVTLGPPLFGWFVERAGSYRGPWIAIALAMLAGLGILSRVRERPRVT